MKLAIQWADEDKVKPYIDKTIDGTVEEINRELNEMRDGRGGPGKSSSDSVLAVDGQ